MNTDKLKRLAERVLRLADQGSEQEAQAANERFENACTPFAILALIAENEDRGEQFRLLDEEYQAIRAERDEAVALLREIGVFSGDVDLVSAFLARIDSETSK